MTKKICAVTVSNYYLEPKKFAVKYLTVGNREGGQPFWFVRHTDQAVPDKHALEGKAIHYAITHSIPFIPDIRHGENVSKHDLNRLKKYGVAV